MINEFTTSPKPQNKNAHIACAILGGAFVALAVVYSLMQKYRGLLGLAALVALTAGIYIYTRYISVKYYYDITLTADGDALLVIRKQIGKRDTTLYMTPLSRIQGVKMQTGGQRQAPSSAYARHSFTPTLMPDTTCLITVKSRLEASELLIECNEEFAELLLKYATEERERKALEEDDY